MDYVIAIFSYESNKSVVVSPVKLGAFILISVWENMRRLKENFFLKFMNYMTQWF